MHAAPQVVAAVTLMLTTLGASPVHGTDLSAGAGNGTWGPLLAALLIIVCAVAGLAITFWSLRNDLLSRREAYRSRARRAGPPPAESSDSRA